LAVVALLLLGACAPPAPEETLVIKVAFPSAMDFSDVPLLLAFERMADAGFPVVPTFYAQTELSITAVVSGQAHIGIGSVNGWMVANQQGEPVVSFMNNIANNWTIVSTPDIQTCADLDGKRVAIHSEGGTSTAMVRAYIELNCPGTAPEYLIIPGSSNRVAALIAGEIDATPAEVVDAVLLDIQQPGQYFRLANFATDIPGLWTSAMWVNRDFAAAHTEEIQTIIRFLLEVHRDIADNPALLVEQAQRFIEFDDETLAALPEVVAAHLALDMFPVNGGVQAPEEGQFTIDFLTNGGQIEAGLAAASVYELSYLNAVLDEIGRR
jgi:ABC-type nitrate/sulfonate/bicarbonate transport system substrate-binding protein